MVAKVATLNVTFFVTKVTRCDNVCNAAKSSIIDLDNQLRFQKVTKFT